MVKSIKFEILKYKSLIFPQLILKKLLCFYIVENYSTIPWDLGSEQLSPSKIVTEEISHKV